MGRMCACLYYDVCVHIGPLWRGVGSVCSSQSESVSVRQLWQDAVLVGHAHSSCYLGQTAAGQFTRPLCFWVQIQIQNRFVMCRSVQVKNWNRRYERQVLLGAISIRGVKEFAFKTAFKTIHTSCSTTVKRQVIPNLWRTNRKCLVRLVYIYLSVCLHLSHVYCSQ